jgi:hypothetical protein
LKWVCHLVVVNKCGNSDYLCNGDTIFSLDKDLELEYEFIFFTKGVYRFYVISRSGGNNNKQVTINDCKIVLKVT